MKKLMKKGRISKYLYSLSVLASLMFPEGVEARPSIKVFKNITRHYKPGKEFNSPVLGMAALQSGLIHNIRFYGNFENGAKDPRFPGRNYIKDHSKDPLWTLTKELFPSPAGHLTVETPDSRNFSKAAKDPKVVAFLFNFANACRDHLEKMEGIEAEKKALTEPKKETYAGRAVILKEIEGLQAQRAANNKKIGLVKKDTSKDSIKKTEELKKLDAELQIEIKAKQKKKNELKKEISLFEKETFEKANIFEKEKEEIKNFEAKKKEILKKISENLDLTEFDKANQAKKDDKASQEKKVFKTHINIINNIEESLKQESTSLYPKGTTEQVLSAYFCEKFSTQADVQKLIENEDESIVDPAQPFPAKEDLLEEEDLPKIASKDTFDLDDYFDLANADVFFRVTPYKPGVAPLSNGNTYPYDRKNNSLLKSEKTFADCAEITGRHVMNMLLYKADVNDFNLDTLEEYVKERNLETQTENPYFANFKAFYAKQGPELANDGDIATRSFWNTVVGDLNAYGDQPVIKYRQGTNELSSGFINFIRVYEKIFSLKLEDFPSESLSGKKDWVRKSMETLFKVVNPLYDYEIDVNKLTEKKGDLSGTVPIKVINATTKKFLFSFDFFESVGIHSGIKKLQTKKVQAQNYRNQLENHKNTIHAKTVEDSLRLLNSEEITEIKPVYRLFKQGLMDNESRIQFIEALDSIYNGKLVYMDSSKEDSVDKNKPALKIMLQHVLEDISWEDRAVLEELTAAVLSLYNNYSDLQKVITQAMKGLVLGSEDSVEISNLLKDFTSLETLNCYKNAYDFKEFKLPNLKHLKKLNLSWTSIDNLDLTDRVLEDLSLYNTHSLKEVSLKNMGFLKKFSIRSSAIQKVKLENVSLTDLNLKRLNLEMVSLKKMKSLKKIDLSGAAVSTIELEDVELKTFDGLDIKKLETLSLINMNSLDFLNSNEFMKLPVKNLIFENIDTIEQLDLRYLSSLETVTFKGSFNKLKAVSFTNSPKLKNIEGLEHLKSLKYVDVRGTSLTKATLKDLAEDVDVMEDVR